MQFCYGSIRLFTSNSSSSINGNGSVFTLLLVECNEKRWRKHLKPENGKWIMHVVCDKAIYGTMNAALLLHKKLAKAFRKQGLVMNLYDPYGWNNCAEDRQLIVLYHIDDLMMSHVSSKVV